MMYKEKLNEILDQLTDTRTICGVELALLKTETAGHTALLFPFNGFSYKTFWEDKTEYIVLLDKMQVYYGPQIESFISEFTNYLGTINTSLHNACFIQIDAIINEYKSNDVRSRSYSDEFTQFGKEIEILQNADRLHKDFATVWYYDLCLALRIKKRLHIIQFIEDKVQDLKESISSTGPGDQFTDIELQTAAEKVAWLHELGIVDIILNLCKTDENAQPNSRKASKIIESFTGIKDTAIKTYLPHINTGKKNDPLKNQKTAHAIAGFKQDYNL